MSEQTQEQLATRRRCRGCYAEIIQTIPGGKWRDLPDESAVCVASPNESPVWHQPLPIAEEEVRRG